MFSIKGPRTVRPESNIKANRQQTNPSPKPILPVFYFMTQTISSAIINFNTPMVRERREVDLLIS